MSVEEKAEFNYVSPSIFFFRWWGVSNETEGEFCNYCSMTALSNASTVGGNLKKRAPLDQVIRFGAGSN